MKIRLLFNFLIIILLHGKVVAQDEPYYHYTTKGNGITNKAFNNPIGNIEPHSAGNSGTGANINVVHHRINWIIDPNSATKTITGTVVTYFTTLVNNVSTVSLDLNKASFNNASLFVNYHGIPCTFSFPAAGNVNILNIILPSTIVTAATLDSITIDYAGIPPGVSGAAQGYQVGGSGINKYVTSLSESYEDRDWWPCKADMQDKIDSMNIIVTVPWDIATADTFWVATNGKLIDSTITGNSRTFVFKTIYPIASYLVCVSVAKFNRYYNVVNISGTMVPVAYYILRNTTGQPAIVTAMDKMNEVIVALSKVIGDYPFKLEKHGYYGGLLGAGGMEHQTFSGINNGSLTSVRTLTHELMHQWFGDNVSFGTWNDLWLAEGFARYSEVLAAELVPGLGYSPFTTLNGFKSSALGINSVSTWIPNANTGNSGLIWSSSYGSAIYQRGCMVVSMLRALSGDTKFFQALTNYQTNLSGATASTDSLKNYFNDILGADIGEFFNDYIGGSGSAVSAVGGIGNPINNINWNTPVPNTLFVQMGIQTKTAGSNVAYFNGPVVVHATNAAIGWTKDTTIIFYDWGAGTLSYAGNGLSAPVTGNLLSYNLSFTPTHLFYDDSSRTLSTGTTTKLSTLAVGFTNIHAVAQNDQVNVIWTFATNAGIREFEIERSFDGVVFSKIGTQPPISSNGAEVTYNWLDIFPLNGDNFYRIRSIGINGEISYSKTVKLNLSNPKSSIIIYPNPVIHQPFFVKLTGLKRGNYVLRLLNNGGQLFFTQTINFTGNNISTMIAGQYVAGNYFLEITDPDHSKTIKSVFITDH